jgi:hypothetical protein
MRQCSCGNHQLMELEDHIKTLNFTPKIHSLLKHGPEHMHCFEGIGDTLEDHIEHMHQMSARIEARISRMKNKNQQAFVHSKIEVVQNCALVQEKIAQSQAASKCVMKRRNPEACVITKGKRAKEERDKGRAETLASLDSHRLNEIKSFHDKKKSELLNN